MITKTEAIELLSRQLAGKAPSDDEWVVIEEKTIDRPFGWVFFYNSKKAIETGQAIYKLAGNGPVIVNKNTGSIDFFGSTPSVDDIIVAYEKNLEKVG